MPEKKPNKNPTARKAEPNFGRTISQKILNAVAGACDGRGSQLAVGGQETLEIITHSIHTRITAFHRIAIITMKRERERESER